MSGKWGSFDPRPDRRGMDELRKAVRHQQNKEHLEKQRKQDKRDQKKRGK